MSFYKIICKKNAISLFNVWLLYTTASVTVSKVSALSARSLGCGVGFRIYFFQWITPAINNLPAIPFAAVAVLYDGQWQPLSCLLLLAEMWQNIWRCQRKLVSLQRQSKKQR